VEDSIASRAASRSDLVIPNASRISEAEEGGVTCNRREEEDSFLATGLPFLLFSGDFHACDLLIFFTSKPPRAAYYEVYPYYKFWSSRIIVSSWRAANYFLALRPSPVHPPWVLPIPGGRNHPPIADSRAEVSCEGWKTLLLRVYSSIRIESFPAYNDSASLAILGPRRSPSLALEPPEIRFETPRRPWAQGCGSVSASSPPGAKRSSARVCSEHSARPVSQPMRAAGA